MRELYQLTACEMVKHLKSGSISVHDALDCLEQRIQQTDSVINALPTRCFDRARQHADQIQKLAIGPRGMLCGLPVTIKDLMPVAAVRTCFGSRIYENYVPEHSDRLVRKIENRGGVVYAKSNTPEFGTGGITFNDVFGITRTPRDINFASGGSSGGAAASLAAGSAWLSQGSDMAGSLRTPASFCGVTSLRPSPGKILSDSEFLPFDVLGAKGPMARNIEDLALFADVMMSGNNDSLLSAARTPVQPARIAISDDLGITSINPEVISVFHKFIDELANTGSNIAEGRPDLSGVHRSFDVLRAHSYAIGLEQTLTDYPSLMKPEVVWNIESGIALKSEQIRSATRTQGQIINRATNFMQNFDLLICPATSVVSVSAELRYPGSDGKVPVPEYYRWLAIAYATTMTALPIITLPCGFTENDMPIGVQLIGKPGGEFELFRYARYIEEISAWSALPVDPVEVAADNGYS